MISISQEAFAVAATAAMTAGFDPETVSRGLDKILAMEFIASVLQKEPWDDELETNQADTRQTRTSSDRPRQAIADRSIDRCVPRWETGATPVNEEWYRRVHYAIERLKDFLAESSA